MVPDRSLKEHLSSETRDPNWGDIGRYRDNKSLRLGNRRRVLTVGAAGFAKMQVCSCWATLILVISTEKHLDLLELKTGHTEPTMKRGREGETSSMWESEWGWETPGHIMVIEFKSSSFWGTGIRGSGEWRTEWCPWLPAGGQWLATASIWVCEKPSKRLARKPSANPTDHLCPLGRAKGHSGLKSEQIWPLWQLCLLCLTFPYFSFQRSLIMLNCPHPHTAHLERRLMPCLLTQSSPS